MSTKTIGTIEAVSEKEGKFGPMISYKINGDWFLLKGAKFKARGIDEGSVVEFEFVTNDRGYKDIVKNTLRPAPEGSEAPASAAANKAPAVPYKDTKQQTISRQSAMNTALEFVKIAVSLEAVPFTAKSKSDNLALLTNWVNTEAARIFNMNTGETWEIEEQPAAVVKKAPAKKAAKPAEEVEDTGYDEYGDDDVPY